jgi:hypothetical protein
MVESIVAVVDFSNGNAPAMSRTHLMLGPLSAPLLAAVTACQPAGQQNSKLPLTNGAAAAVRNGARIDFTGQASAALPSSPRADRTLAAR